MNEIDGYRTKVSSQSIPVKEALTLYTGHNTAMLNVVQSVSQISDNADLAKTAAAYTNFLQGKERAVMSKTFAADRFESGTLRRFGALVAEQDAYFDSFRELAAPEHVALFDQKLSGPAVDEVQRMRDVAFEIGSVRADGFGIDASHWFASMTKKINLMKEVDDELAAGVLRGATESRDSARTSLTKLGVVVAVAVVAAAFLIFWIARGIVGPLNKTVGALELVASGDYSQRLDIRSQDETGSALKEIIEGVEATVSKISEIATATVEQASNATQVGEAIQGIAEVTEQAAAGSEEMASSSEQLGAQATALGDLVSRFKTDNTQSSRSGETTTV